jgi:hypothetical protein
MTDEEISALYDEAWCLMTDLQTAIAMRECWRKKIEWNTKATELMEEAVSETIGAGNLVRARQIYLQDPR